MKTVNIKLAVADDEFYDWFIEPQKIYGELPNLVIRLLTAYANNSELAYQIDQYLDKDSEPEAFEMREAILQAITQLNSLEAMANQELEALDDDNDADTTSDADEDDIIITSPTGSDVYTPESVARNIGSMIGLVDETANEGIPEPEMPSVQPSIQPSVAAPVASSPDFENKVFSALDTLTSQISNLTSAVTQMVNINSQPMMIPVQAGIVPVQAGMVSMQTGVSVATSQTQNSGTTENQVAVAVENNKPLNNAQNSPDLSVSSVNRETTPPTPANPAERKFEASTTIVENPVENVENISAESAEGEDDSYSVPDFMSDMIDSCL